MLLVVIMLTNGAITGEGATGAHTASLADLGGQAAT